MTSASGGNHDSISTQCTATQAAAHHNSKVVNHHKTPQIKPSAPGLTMMHISDNFSQEGGYCGGMKNEDFALPLVGRRRKASEAGYVAK